MSKPLLMPKVLYGIPTTKQARWSREWDVAKSNVAFPLGSSIGWHYVLDKPIADARNEICHAAIQGNYEYVFMLGDDVLPTPDIAMRMLDKIGKTFLDEHDRPVRASMITGVYWRKTSPTEAYIYRDILRGWYRNWRQGDFFAVDYAGCDALLIEVAMLRGVLEQDPGQPFFSTDWTWREGDPPSAIQTEDFWFYTRARKFGYRVFCDSGIQCLHEDRSSGMFFGLTPDMAQAGGTPLLPEGEETLLVADVGAGWWSRYLGENVQLIRFDGRESVKPDVLCDIRHIPEEWFGKFDVVRSSHSLEHLARADTMDAVKHWTQLLKDGGKILISVPNMEYAFRTILDGEDGPAKVYASKMVWGSQDHPLDFHLNGFTPRKLEAVLTLLGCYSDVTVVEEEEGVNLRVEGIYHAPAPLPPLLDMWEQIREQEQVPTPAPNGVVHAEPATTPAPLAGVGDLHRDQEGPPAESPADAREGPAQGPDLSRALDLRREPEEVAGDGAGAAERPRESDAVHAGADRR